MEREKVINKVKEIVSQFLENSSAPVNMNASLTGDLGLSSLEIITIVTEVEDYYGIVIPTQEYKSIVVVDDYIDCIMRHINEK